MKPVFKFFMRLAHCTSGSALVEMTLIAPVAIALMAGVVDFAMALANQATAGKSVRDAARYLASLPAVAICPGGVAGWGVLKARNLAVYGTTSPGSPLPPPLIPGWEATDDTYVQVTWSTGCTNSPPIPFNITVTAKFSYNPIIITSLVPGSTSVTALTMSATDEEASIAWFE
jgi:Flp pilus assembly protein TadG